MRLLRFFFFFFFFSWRDWLFIAMCYFKDFWVSVKDGSFLNESVWRNDSLTRTNWPDSTFHFVCSFVFTDWSLCCSLFSYQSGKEDWANHMLNLGHFRWISANEKQESIATVSMKKKQQKKTFHFFFFIAHRSYSVKSVSQTPLAYLQYMSCMSFNVKVNIHIIHCCVESYSYVFALNHSLNHFIPETRLLLSIIHSRNQRVITVWAFSTCWAITNSSSMLPKQTNSSYHKALVVRFSRIN